MKKRAYVHGVPALMLLLAAASLLGKVKPLGFWNGL